MRALPPVALACTGASPDILVVRLGSTFIGAVERDDGVSCRAYAPVMADGVGAFSEEAKAVFVGCLQPDLPGVPFARLSVGFLLVGDYRCRADAVDALVTHEVAARTTTRKE